MHAPRIILADDHPLVLEEVAKLVEEFGEVVGKVNNGRLLLDVVPRLRPDLVIMDLSMPIMNGLETARELKHLFPEIKIIFLTMHADPGYRTAAFESGGSGYLLKRSVGFELKQAVHHVLRGRKYVTALPDKTALTGAGEGDRFSQASNGSPHVKVKFCQ